MRSRRHPLLAAALAGSLLAAGCVSLARDPDRLPPASEPAPTRPPPPVSGTTRASASYELTGAFSPSSFRPGGRRAFTVSKLSPPDSIGSFRSALTAVLVFPLVAKPAGCLQRVRLRLRVLGGRGRWADLAVYPSALLSLARGRRPERLPPWASLLDNRPRGLAEVGLEGWAEIDITALYRTWAGGREFPSQGRSVPRGTPLVVSIRPPAWTDTGDFVRQFAGAAAGADAPQLAWTARGGCSG